MGPIRVIVNFISRDSEAFLGAARSVRQPVAVNDSVQVLVATRSEPGCLATDLYRELGQAEEEGSMRSPAGGEGAGELAGADVGENT